MLLLEKNIFHKLILSPSGNERGGKPVFAGWVIEQLRCPFGFILLLFAMNVVMGYQGFQ